MFVFKASSKSCMELATQLFLQRRYEYKAEEVVQV